MVLWCTLGSKVHHNERGETLSGVMFSATLESLNVASQEVITGLSKSIFSVIIKQFMDELEPQINIENKIPPRQEALAFIWETVKIVVISLAIILPIRYFLVQPFFVKGASMENTFQDGNYILIDELSYKLGLPHRGDVVVFRYPEDHTQFFIKRIIGLPEETIEIKNDKVIIHNKQIPEGFALTENYLEPGQHTVGDMKIKLDPNEYFVLGDNRLRSSDSRRWGPLNSSLITGRVFFRAWPVNELTKFNQIKY